MTDDASPMQARDLSAHVEGGHFRQVFKSDAVVTRANGQARAALTHIYFALHRGEVSRLHKVASDEVWNLYQGEGLYLHTWDGTDNPPRRHVLSAASNTFCHVVPAGMWQAAEPVGESVLVGCSVAPGFEFEDFELTDPHSLLARQLVQQHPHMARFTA